MDKMTLASVPCDMARPNEFWDIVESWLKGNTFRHLVTLTPEMIMLAQSDSGFKRALLQADMRLPDGTGIVWAQWYMRSAFWALWPSLIAFMWRDIERITGVDMISQLSSIAERNNQSIYLLGGTPQQNKATAALLQQKHPRLAVHRAGDHVFDLQGPKEIVADIQAKKPSILLVAYGPKKQIEWIEAQRHNLPSVKIAVGLGGAFAMLSEEKKRAPLFFREHNMEWMWRLILEPSRLPRIWQATISFPLLVNRLRKQNRREYINQLN